MYNIIYMVSGHPAGGTSMMMGVMIAGGIEGIYQDGDDGEFPILNNPHGKFEGKWISLKPEQLVGKVFKGLGSSCERIPEEYLLKVIRILRNTDDMVLSRHRRKLKRFQNGFAKTDKFDRENTAKHIERRKKSSEEALAKRKNTEILYVDFDDMLNDTENQVKRIAEFVECPFDIDKAVSAVDKTLNHGEGFDYGLSARVGNDI